MLLSAGRRVGLPCLAAVFFLGASCLELSIVMLGLMPRARLSGLLRCYSIGKKRLRKKKKKKAELGF